MSVDVKYVEFKSLDDLIKLLASSPTPIVHHLEVKGKHVYFVSIAFFGTTFTYFFTTMEELSGKYIVYHIYKQSTSFSKTFSSDPNERSIPILEVKRQNIFPVELVD